MLTAEDFRQIASESERAKAAIARRKAGQRKLDADKLLTQHILNDLASKGRMYKYTYRGKQYQVDPRQLKQSRARQVKHFGRAGINIKALMLRTDNQWISRSRQQIQWARFDKKVGDRFIFLTDKTDQSKFKGSAHRNVIQLKNYSYYAKQPPGKDGYLTNARAALAGDAGVFCDCEDFGFRRNYWVTQAGADVTGDSSIKPETAFPKITHSKGERGPLCVHLIKSCGVMINQPRMAMIVARAMEREAKSVSPGLKTLKATKKDHEAMEDLSPGQVDAIKNQWLDKQGRRMFQTYRQAAQSFSKHRKKVLSKKTAQVEKKVEEVQSKLNRAEAEKRTAIQKMLKMGMKPGQVADIYSMPVEEVEKLSS